MLRCLNRFAMWRMRTLLVVVVLATVSSEVTAGRFEVSSPEEEARIVSEIRASHFLTQATFGPTMDEIKALGAEIREHGFKPAIEAWIDHQFELPPTHQVDTLIDMMNDNGHAGFAQQRSENIGDRLRMDAWWHNAIAGEDQLRQRVAWALSQIFVVNDGNGFNTTQIEPSGLPRVAAYSQYYDIFVDGAFGNYRTMLGDVTVHPVMGVFLTHLNNRKANPAANTFPDENYARELMQLFTIGLYKVKDMTGEYARDANGNLIPTYDNEDIDTMARVFTGWTFNSPGFAGTANYTQPMRGFASQHDAEEKVLLDGTVLRARRSAQNDADKALDMLFNQPETPPFVAKRLIQRMNHSNPTPKYIEQVARRFFGTRRQPRGDMKSVVKALLMSNEATGLRIKRIRDENQNVIAVEANSRRENYTSLREPVIRLTALVRGLNGEPTDRKRFHLGDQREALNQTPFKAPSVFNFYSPDHQPPGPLSGTDLVAPEFEVLTSVSVNNLHNLFREAVRARRLVLPNYENRTKDVLLDITPLYEIANDGGTYREFVEGSEDLLEYLDLLFCQGTMSEETKRNIIRAMERTVNNSTTRVRKRDAVQAMLTLVLTSPDCAIVD